MAFWKTEVEFESGWGLETLQVDGVWRSVFVIWVYGVSGL